MFVAVFFFILSANGQHKLIIGHIRDGHSGEPVPFASVQLKLSGIGRQADSSGSFMLRITLQPGDSLQISSVGFQDYSIAVTSFLSAKDTVPLTINLVPGKFTAEVVVRKKVNRGLLMWQRIVAHKPMNDRYRFHNFSYELYNKLELDLNHVNKEKLAKNFLFRPFRFVLENVDTSGGSSVLPSYLTEAISDYYYQKDPLKRREVFKGVKTIGVQNESISKLLGGMDQNINFYNNFIPVLGRQFISPISDNGDAHYNYKIADTQYVGGRRLIHFLFVPKRAGENTFEGDCWVHDTSFAIQKMNLRLGKEANLNFVSRLSLIQEYQLINDSIWFLSKDKFVVDINPIGKDNLSFIGRKTTTYRQVRVNDASVEEELAKNKQLEETVLPAEATARPEAYWTEARHESLTAAEAGIYKMVDTLLKSPAFIRYTRWANFAGTGYMRLGKLMIGPWMNWITTNSVEGLRLRFDLGTNSKWSKKLILHGYAAYGFGDGKWKGAFDALYLFNKKPRMYLYGEYVNDFERGQAYFDALGSDNIFALAVRKHNVPLKYLRVQREEMEWFREITPSFSFLLSAQSQQYHPVRNLPAKAYFDESDGQPLNSFELSGRLRFAYLEKFVENTFYRSSLGSPYPIAEFRYTHGLPNVFKSSYRYDKIAGSISYTKKIPPLGKISMNAFAGKTYGTVPYLFLDIAPGNEIYYYNKYAFNLMNRYEFIHDRYLGVNLEHNIGAGLFRFVPITRKLKFRQLWTAKALWGSLSEENRLLNAVDGFTFQSLNGRTYLELGTGIDNILKVFRVDFLWRLSPVSREGRQKFGVFGSIKFDF